MDVTDMVEYNIDVNSLSSSFFHLDRNDPTAGFPFDASNLSGHTIPAKITQTARPPPSTPTSPSPGDGLGLRLQLGSHLAQHIRHQLEEQKGYTSTVGISTNKLLSKLVGNVNKPKGQTTLMPPYITAPDDDAGSNVTLFLDRHDIGKIPGIGFKTAQKIRQHVLDRPAAHETGLVYGGTKEKVFVGYVRRHESLNAEVLERLLAGPGVPKGLGEKVWGLVNGVDDSEVGKAKDVPQQISIVSHLSLGHIYIRLSSLNSLQEDSYIKLDGMPELKKQMTVLSISLIKRMRLDLTAEADDDDNAVTLLEEESKHSGLAVLSRRWIAHPRTLRLTTRPRPPRNPDGSRSRLFNRVSKSSEMPFFIFTLKLPVDILAEKLVNETLIPLFRQLHPEKSGWDLSLVNICASNMSHTAAETKDGAGRDIARMFRRQENVLKEWKVEDLDVLPSQHIAEDTQDDLKTATPTEEEGKEHGSEDIVIASQESLTAEDCWNDEEDIAEHGYSCQACGAVMPSFAMVAHQRYVSSRVYFQRVNPGIAVRHVSAA